MLVGGSDNDNLWQWPATKLTEQLDLLVSVGGNYLRNTMSDRDEGDVYAFKEIKENVYDLNIWNEQYWERLQFFLDETSKRDIFVQLTLWDWFDLVWIRFDKHPLNPKNNINWEPGVITQARDYYGGSVKSNNQEVLTVQKKYVDKLLSISLNYGNVLYNISNESSLGFEWEKHWATYLKKKADEYEKQIYVTSMHLVAPNGLRLVLSNRDIYSYVEISQNNQDSRGARGKTHWENVIRWRNIISQHAMGPMPMNNVKIYGNDSSKVYIKGTANEAKDRFWKNVFGGAASVRFHRPPSGIGLSERAQANIKAMNLFLNEFDLFSASPFYELDLIGSSEGYALANIGKEYAVYLPAGLHAVKLDPWVYATKFSIKYLDIDSGEWSKETISELEWPGDEYINEHNDLSFYFGYQKGILISSPNDKPYVAVIKVLE